MIQLNDRDCESLVEARNAMGVALRRLVDVIDASGDDAGQKQADSEAENELTQAVALARGTLKKYGEHQAFVVI